MPLVLKEFLSRGMEARKASSGEPMHSEQAGVEGTLDGQPFAFFGPAPVDNGPSALGLHPHQESVGL